MRKSLEGVGQQHAFLLTTDICANSSKNFPCVPVVFMTRYFMTLSL